jgi:predicted enzyme related to lactoylglutathione lyase
MNPVVHFEMAYDDPSRVAAFYRAAFGWKMKMLGEKMGDYVLATTTATSSDGMIKKPGAINGGFFPKKPDWPADPSVVISVDDIKNAMASVTSAGGQVLGEPMDIPGIGAYVSFRDSEGNRVGMLEPVPMPKAKKKPAAKKRPTAAKKASRRR